MRCSAVDCSIVQYSAVDCSIVQYSAVDCSIVQYSAVKCRRGAVECGTSTLDRIIGAQFSLGAQHECSSYFRLFTSLLNNRSGPTPCMKLAIASLL